MVSAWNIYFDTYLPMWYVTIWNITFGTVSKKANAQVKYMQLYEGKVEKKLKAATYHTVVCAVCF